MAIRSFALALLAAGCAHVSGAPERQCAYAWTTSDAQYANGEVALAAAWLRPETPEPTLAVVILQGSGESDRSNAWAAGIAERLAQCGVAVLLTDKRGSGASGGDWTTASMLDLAGDGAAGLAWVAAQPGIDRDRIGFLGLSQGGKVAPAAAMMNADADFVIGWVTSVDAMRDGLLYELEQTYRENALSDPQIETLQQMARAAFVWVETGEGWDEYQRLRTEILNSPLARGAQSWPATQDDAYWVFWRVNAQYTPLHYWDDAIDGRGLRGLVVLGAEDARDNVDVDTTVRLLRENVQGDLAVEVIPGVGHSLRGPDNLLHPRALALTLGVIRSEVD